MIVYRVFYWDKGLKDSKAYGGPLHVPKVHQGGGRHDLNEDGVLYCALEPLSAIAEAIQPFRNRELKDIDLERKDIAGMRKALVKIKADDKLKIADLRDARQLLKLGITPVEVSTHDRVISTKVSKYLYDKKYDGFLWWSSLESKWTNVTFYESGAAKRLKVQGEIQPLSINLAELKEAADYIGVLLPPEKFFRRSVKKKKFGTK